MLKEIIKDFDSLFFDFDGTLLDSEPYHLKAHNKVLSEITKKICMSATDFLRYVGKKDSEIFDMYKQDFNVDFEKEKMITKKVSTKT